MADEIKREVIIDVKLDDESAEKRVSKLTKTIAELRADTEKMIKTNQELEKHGRKNSQVYLENTKGIEINKQMIQEATSERKNLIQTMLSEDKSIKALTARNKELIRQRNEISTSTQEGRMQIALINRELDENTELIRKNSAAHEQQRQNIGNYKSALDGLSPGLGDTVEKHVEMAQTVSKSTLALGAAGAAAGGLFAAYVKSTKGATDFAKAQDVLSSATDILTDSFGNWIDTMLGDAENGMGALEKLVTGFIFWNVDSSLALQASIKAQAKETLRQLEISERFAKQFYKEDERRAELARRIRDDENRSYTERLAAAEKVTKYMENAGDRQIIVWQAEIDAIKASTTNYNENREAQLKVAELEAEISDKREEITGKLTENAMAVMALKNAYADFHRELRIQQLDEQLQQQQMFNELLTESEQAKLDLMVDINKNFSKRITQETKDRLKAESEAKKKELKEHEQIERLKTEATVGGLAIVTKEKSQARVIGNAIFKQDAIKETFVNTQAAATAAYKALAGIPIIGPALGIAAAIAASVYGFARVAAITGVQFADGGKVPGYARGGLSGTRIQPHHGVPIQRSNGDNLLATVKTGEVILNERHQKALGGDATFRAIGVPGFNSGGYTGMVQTNNAHKTVQDTVERMEMLNVLSQVRTVLVLQDFEVAQQSKNIPINKAQVL